MTHADDTVIYFSDRDINVIEQNICDDLSCLLNWLELNELIIILKKGKTECIHAIRNR